MDSSSQIKTGAILSYISIGINVLSGLIYTPWMIHSIGKEDYGLFTLALSVISLFVFDFGLSSAVTRFVSNYLAENRQDKVNNCLGLVYRLYFIIDIFLFLLLSGVYLFIPGIYKELTPEEIEKFKVIYIMAASFSVVSLPFIPVNGILTANEKFTQIKLCDILHKVLVVSTMTIVLLLGYGLYTLVMVNIWSGLIAFVAKSWCVFKYTKTTINISYFNKNELKELLGFSGWATIISLCKRLIFTISPTIWGFFCGSASIAVFGIANAIEGYVFYFADAISGMFLPRVSRVLIKENGSILPLMIKVGRIQLFIVSAIIIGFICIGNDFINLWVGEQFNDCYICIILLIIPSFFQLPQEVGTQAIIVQNKVKEQAMVFIVMGLINILLGIFLTWQFGVLGMCVSVSISFFLRTIGLDLIFYKILKIDIFSFFRKTFGNIGVSLIFSLIIGVGMNHFIISTNWLIFLVKVSLFIAIFCICSSFALNDYEKDLFKRIICLKKSK